MRQVRAFALFWWDFVVGDDYRIALGVVVALGATAGLVRLGVSAWWLTPVLVVAMLALSVAEVAAKHRRAR